MILTNLKLIHRKIFNLIFPRYCAGCGKPETYLCEKCVATADRADSTEIAEGVLVAFNYHHPAIKKAIWRLKYHGAKEVGKILGRETYACLIEEIAERKLWNNRAEKIIVLPVPLGPARERERGFNQSALIARAFSAGDLQNFETIEGVLVKIKNTSSQASVKSRKERLNNLRNCFHIIAPEKIKNRDIIVIDDVATTGATLTECRKTLRAAGARSVILLAVAGG